MQLHHEIDITAKTNIEQAIKQIDALDATLKSAGVEADKASDAFKTALSGMADFDMSALKETLSATKEAFAKLIDEYRNTEAVLSKTPLGSKERSDLSKKLSSQKADMQDYANTIAAIEQRMQELDNSTKKTGTSSVTVRTQIRNLTNELNAMRLSGRENTEEFQQLSEELGRLALAQRETTNAMRMDSTGATQWHGMIEGMQGLMGAYTAASGVMGLFTQDQEKLMQVQTKMQSTMGILMGMQQVANTLHSTSTFRLRTLSAVTATYGKVIDGVTKFMSLFTKSEVTAQMAAKALTATLTMGLTVAIPMAVAAIEKLVKRNKEANENIKQVAEIGKDSVAGIMSLASGYRKLGDDMEEKKKFIEENAEAVAGLGVAVNSVNDADNLFIDNTDAFVKSQMLRAQASAARQKAEELAKKLLEKKLKLETFDKDDDGWKTITTLDPEAIEAIESMGQSLENFEVKTRNAKGRTEDAIAELEKEMLDLYSVGNDFEKQAQSLFSNYFEAPKKETIEKGLKATENEADKAYKQFVTSFEKAKDRYDEDTLTNELDKIELRKELQLKAIREAYDAVKKQMEEAGMDTSDLDMKFVEQSGFIEDSAKREADAYTKYQAEALRQSAEDYAGYYDKRNRIEQDYIKEREKYFKADGTLKEGLEGMDAKALNDEITRQKETDLAAIDELFASRQGDFEIWCNKVADASLLELMSLINEAQIALDMLEADENADPNQLALLRAGIKRAEKAVNSANTDLSPKQRSVKDWKALNEVLGDCVSSFDEIGESAGGTVGQIMASAGSIATGTTSMVNDIMHLQEIANRSIEETAEAGGAAVQAVEQGTIILSILSTALKVMNLIRNVVNANNVANERAAQSARDYANALDDANRKAAILRSETIMGSDSFGKMRTSVNDAVSSLKKYNDTVSSITQKQNSKTGFTGIDYLNSGFVVDQRSGWQKFWGKEKNLTVTEIKDFYDETGKLNVDKLRTYYEAYEEDLTDASKEAITEILNQWDDVQNALDGIKEYLTDIFGSLGEEISDALTDAFENGTDAGKAFGESLSNILEKWTEQMAYSSLLQPIFTKMQKQVEDITRNQGLNEQQRLKRMIDSLADGMDEVIGVQDLYNEYLQNAKEMAAQRGLDLFSSEKESITGSKGDIATASQDSIDELNGRATAIQSHTFSISENTKTLVSQCASILDSLFRIDTNTQRLRAIESDMVLMRGAVTEIRDKGVIIRN